MLLTSRFGLLAALLILLLPACGRKVAGGGPATDDAAAVRTAEARRIVKRVLDNRTTTQYLDARAKVDLESDKLNIGGTATIRLERDKAIWMSVKKFGLEGARALIRPDSFFLINRLQGDYIAEPLSYIEEKYKIPARFDLLQDIILGNPVFFSEDVRVGRDAGNLVLTTTDRNYDNRYVLDEARYQLERMELNELAQARGLVVENENFETVSGMNNAFPMRRRVAVAGGSAGDARIELEFSRLETGQPVEMPFSRR